MSEDKKVNEDNKVNEEEVINEDGKQDESDKKQPFVPLKKQSKLNQKEFHAKKRGSWGNVNPVTRTPPNPKAYNRMKQKRG